MIIRFKNWEKFNPPSSKTHSWFRLNSNLPMLPIWDELSSDGLKIFIFLLCQANESAKRGQIHVSSRFVSRRVSTSEKEVNRAIKILKEYQVIEVRAPSGLFMDSEEIRPTNVLTYVTNVRTNEHMPDSANPECMKFDFELLYKKYPRKEGKKRGMELCKREIRKPEDFSLLEKAIEAYTAHIERSGTEARFIKHFSSFMAAWREWLDPETGSALDTAHAKKEKDHERLLSLLEDV